MSMGESGELNPYNEPALITPNLLVPTHLTNWEVRYEAYQQAIVEESERNPDPVKRALFTRLMERQEATLWLDEGLRTYVQEVPDDAPPVMTRKTFSAFQEQVIPLPKSSPFAIKSNIIDLRSFNLRDPKYPKGYDHPEGWDPVFTAMDNEPMRRVNFLLHLERDLQSNVLGRFPAAYLVPLVLGRRSINLYSGGASFGLNEKAQKHYRTDSRHYDIGQYVVGRLDRDNNNTFEPTAEDTAQFYELFLRQVPLEVDKIIAIDHNPPYEPQIFSSAYANCFTPREFANRKYRTLVNRLLTDHSDSVAISWGDFSAKDHVERMQRRFPWWFHLPNRVVQFISSEYISTPEQLEQTAQNARALAGEDGYIVRIDFVQRTADNKLDYETPKQQGWDRTPFNYNCYVTPAGDPNAKPLHLFQMEDGRCKVIALGEDLPAIEFGILKDAV